ncbi:hypothetical protein JD844_025920 [Phrynosoma platyrhinos]|uniref:Cation efflux protein cytoplasmic domain-containing protein n=1 Tax=Phrynosoma platyrhinos TaxID=52577 RepID=A0ABQ7T0M4_PHRPL|nr:hypothetical protein JD844_025920 [Phrynosoma platyrhinos]
MLNKWQMAMLRLDRLGLFLTKRPGTLGSCEKGVKLVKQGAFAGLPPENGHAAMPMEGLETEPPAAPHCHRQGPCSPSQSQQKLQAQRKLRIACAVCFLFMIGEVIGAPRGVEFRAVKEMLLSVKGVKGAHDLHLWALTLSHHVVAVHVAIESGADMEVVRQEATALLQSKFGFVSCTIQVERYLEDMATCHQCQDPRD